MFLKLCRAKGRHKNKKKHPNLRKCVCSWNQGNCNRTSLENVKINEVRLNAMNDSCSCDAEVPQKLKSEKTRTKNGKATSGAASEGSARGTAAGDPACHMVQEMIQKVIQEKLHIKQQNLERRPLELHLKLQPDPASPNLAVSRQWLQ